jgi:hypothetical protein
MVIVVVVVGVGVCRVRIQVADRVVLCRNVLGQERSDGLLGMFGV